MDPSRDASTRGIFRQSPDGTRTRLDASVVVVAFDDGRELAFGFSGHPVGGGGAAIHSWCRAPDGDAPPRRGVPDVFSSIAIHPGGGNALSLSVEARRRTDGAIVAGETPVGAALLVAKGDMLHDDGSARSAVDDKSLVMDLGGGAELVVHLPRAPARPDAVQLLASGLVWVGFGGCNTISVVVQR